MKMQYSIFAEVNGKPELVGTQIAGFAQRAIHLFRTKNAMRKFNEVPFPALALTEKTINEE